MFDEEFLRALESCEPPESEFGHAAYLRAAYLCLQQSDFAGALQRIRRAIRYHETITVAYVALVQQHIYERGNGGERECAFNRCWSACRYPLLLRRA